MARKSKNTRQSECEKERIYQLDIDDNIYVHVIAWINSRKPFLPVFIAKLIDG